MHDYVDEDDVENDYDGDLYECYIETGRNCAESQIVTDILDSYKEKVSSEVYLEAWELITEHFEIETE